MAQKCLIQFPIFAPPILRTHHKRPATEVRFARWNNANSEKFVRRQRNQNEIEDELRFRKRFDSPQNISNMLDEATTSATAESSNQKFKSIDSRSAPSKSRRNPQPSHPAFRRVLRPTNVPADGKETATGVKVRDHGVSYEFPEAPFLYQYSYTETPNVKPIKLREPLIAPFAPDSMPRPWTGRKPLPSSKKKFEFDSFKLPPPHKKGVKPVQKPGPFLPGSGPKYVQSREEVLGEPLSKEEILELVKGCSKSPRQLNMGRDGLTHNMLENIHAHWKRRRVCKIKCKGVCTVDIDNVRQQLEEKTGGKVIHCTGGVLFLFRGRNYNYKTRPRFPLMLWKPVTPVYPRLIKRAPEGLTLEEATEMRKKGRNLTPICKLGKNGFYSDLAKNVREAFEECELVRINCQGMNGSDYRRIGAKLKDLVPCVLISFECEHILMWRGGDWRSSLPKLEAAPVGKEEEENFSMVNAATSSVSSSEIEALPSLNSPNPSAIDESSSNLDTTTSIISKGLGKNLLPIDSNAVSTENLSENREPEGVLMLLKQAVDNGSAVVLDNSCLDADIVFSRAVALAKTAPPGPVFAGRAKKVAVQKEESVDSEVKEGPIVWEGKRGGSERKSLSNQRMKKEVHREDYLNVVPRGSLGVDELAKLLA